MEKLNNVQNKFHHLAQFLAAFSNSYLSKAEDDSQSNLKWSVTEKALISRSVNGIYLSLSFKDVMLRVIKNNTVKTLDLSGLTHSDIDAWIRSAIADLGLDASAFHYNLGFRLETPFDNFITLDANDKKAISNLIKQRNIVQKTLEEIREKHTSTTEIRIWPHHFDTGMLIDKSEQKNMSKGISLGYAIADNVCGAPYFYAYVWPGSAVNYENLPEPKYGMWVIEENWKGALITVNMLYSTRIIKSFYREIITCFIKNMQ